MMGREFGDGLPVPSSFVSTNTMTVAELLATYPANAANLGKYARVSDLYGACDEVLRCCAQTIAATTTYYWRPQRTDYSQNMGTTQGTMTVTPLLTPPQIRMNGTLIGNITVNFVSTNVWPGCAFDITSGGVVGLNTITLANLLGGNLLLTSGTTRRVVYAGGTSPGFYAQ